MNRTGKLILAKSAVVLGAIPIVLWAYEYGPDPGYVGVPGEHASCAAGGICHVGTPNSGPGGITANFAGSYTPGVTQHVMVTIADSAPTQKAWGFELTARMAGTPSTMAGSFQSTDNFTQLVCSQPNLVEFQQIAYDAGGTQQCPAGETLQYIEHSLAGFDNSVGKLGSYTYQFDWTPPATDAGNIVIYMAANSGLGLPAVVNGTHTYTNTYTLTPAPGGTAPQIAAGQVVNGASFAAPISPGSWVQIKGSNLAAITDTWSNAVGGNGSLPTSLDNVNVTIGGQMAYVEFVSPGQVNVLAPPNIGTGPLAVTVMTPAGTSAAATVTSQTASPAFFLWPGGYAVATRPDFSLAVKNGTFAGTTTVPAKPGDTIILWGTGFGPTNPTAPAGFATPSGTLYNTASPVTVTVGTANATVLSAVLAPGSAGLYQVAIQLPASLANGDYPIVATVNGAASPNSTLLTIQQ
jgi:uncharacterized protein (TIGR03437 family)